MRSLAVLLIVLPLVFASVTVTLSVHDGKVSLQKIQAEASRSQLSSNYNKNVVKGTLTLSDKVYTEQNAVNEEFSTSSNVLLKNSMIKRGQAKITFTIISNPKEIDISARLKGSALIALFYVRNMDVKVSAYINKAEGTGNVTVSGFVEMPAPQVTVKNLLKVMIPKLKKQVSEAGLELVKLDYKVSGRKMPPISKVEFELVVKGSKSKILNSLGNFGIPTSSITQFVNLNDTATRKIDGEADLSASLKRVNKHLYTSFSIKAKANGNYINTTAYNEIKMRLKPILKSLNATQMIDYLEKTDKFSMALTITTDEKVNTKATFNGIYFKNVKGFWELVMKLEKEKNINFQVLCNGKIVTPSQALTSCTG